MKLDTKTLVIGALLIGGFLWWRSRKKTQELEVASEDSATESSSSGGGGGGGSVSSGGTSTPTTTSTTLVKKPSFKPILRDRIKERIQSGNLLSGSGTTTPSYKPQTTFNVSPISLPKTPQGISTNTQLKSAFLTFDGNYKPASNHFFDGNM